MSMPLEEEIAKLKEKIEGYELYLEKAIAENNETDKILFGGLIQSGCASLNKLLPEQTGSSLDLLLYFS
jgi:hypothetical protein